MENTPLWRTDLALEAADTGDGRLPDGVFCETSEENGVHRTAVRIETDAAAKRLGRPKGVYYTLEGGQEQNGALAGCLASLLRSLLPPQGEGLVVGLGNRSVTPDALGPLAVDRVIATAHLVENGEKGDPFSGFRPVCCLAPGTAGETGLEAGEIVASLCRRRRTAFVLAVDALAARSVTRLGRTVQLSDTGIAPGAGVLNRRMALSRETLGVPVFSLGIPTVIDAATLLYDMGAPGKEGARSLVVTPKNIDRIVSDGAFLLAEGINRALQTSLSAGEVRALMT